MRYKYIVLSLSSVLFTFAFLFNSGCGPVDNFQNQRQISLIGLSLQGGFNIDAFFPAYDGVNITTTDTIIATFSKNPDQLSLQNSVRLTETYYDNGQLVINDLTANTIITVAGNVATFRIVTPNSDGGLLRSNSRYQLTVFPTALAASDQSNLAFSIYQFYTGFNFDAVSNNSTFTDPFNPPSVIDINYYEICGQPYMYIFFNEDLQRAPIVNITTGIFGAWTPGGAGAPPFQSWPAYSGRMDVFGVHINSGGPLSGHKIRINNTEVVDLQGDIMQAPDCGGNCESDGPFNQLISPC